MMLQLTATLWNGAYWETMPELRMTPWIGVYLRGRVNVMDDIFVYVCALIEDVYLDIAAHVHFR